MADAARLSVKITGDASGLISSLEAAQNMLSSVSESAGALISGYDGKEAQLKITALDNTAAGVASARANIDSLTDKTVTISVKYASEGMKYLASGTRSAREGLAVVNDEKGIGDPRELIEHNGSLMMYSGRDVIVPLSRGDKVYTADETKRIMSALNLPHYASGKNNEAFTIEQNRINHYKKTHNTSPYEELQMWNALIEQFNYDSEATAAIQEEIFAAQQEIWKQEKAAASDALANYKSNSDAWIKYQTEVCSMSVSEQIEAYERQIENYNAMVSEMVASSAYSAAEIKEIWDGFYEYKSGVELKIGKLENQEKHGVYEKWQSDAKNWKNIRDTYDDWEESGDSPIKFYERSIERISEMYSGHYIGWQEYRDDTMDAILDLYEAKTDKLDELLDKQKNYISDLKQQFSDEENALSEKWDTEDRHASIADTKYQMSIYKNAVTQKGVDKYNSLSEELKKLNREEEMYRLEKEHNATISELEGSYDTVEKNKKYLLAKIEDSGIDIENLVRAMNTDISGIQTTITTLFAQTIAAIKSLNISQSSYSDNRNININGSYDDIVEALQNRVGLSISRGSYY